MDELILEQMIQWLNIARKDLAVAEHLYKHMYPQPYEQICFQCQQSGEKYLKSFLVINNKEPPKTHDLMKLNEMCESINQDFSKLKAECDFLTDYGVSPRYPQKLGEEIEEHHARIALNYAKRIRDFVMSKTGLPNEANEPELF